MQDFLDGTDLLDYSPANVHSMAEFTLVQWGSNVVIEYGASGDSVQVNNTTPSNLTDSDFIFTA